MTQRMGPWRWAEAGNDVRDQGPVPPLPPPEGLHWTGEPCPHRAGFKSRPVSATLLLVGAQSASATLSAWPPQVLCTRECGSSMEASSRCLCSGPRARLPLSPAIQCGGPAGMPEASWSQARAGGSVLEAQHTPASSHSTAGTPAGLLPLLVGTGPVFTHQSRVQGPGGAWLCTGGLRGRPRTRQCAGLSPR